MNSSGSPEDASEIEDLLRDMTVAEKVGQLVGTYVDGTSDGHTLEAVREQITEHHLGSVSVFGFEGALVTDSVEAARVTNDLQRTATERTRLGIPLHVPVDAVHGHAYVSGATVHPNNLGLAAARDPSLAEASARVTATEAVATGATHNYSPTCDVVRDPRWGRAFETFGESPHLCAEMVRAKVWGYQGDDPRAPTAIEATAKHFPAYGEPARGEDASPVVLSDSGLNRTYLPPFEAAIEAGVKSVMPCYNAVNAVPAHGSRHYLTKMLRQSLGFDGRVVSDWFGVKMLFADHRTADSMRTAVWQSFRAGLDVASVGGPEVVQLLCDLVEADEIPERAIDESVRRVLRSKANAGLFDDPFVDETSVSELLGAEEHQDVALECTRQSLTLLKNDDVLPLTADAEEIFVTGPNADDLSSQFGGWSLHHDGGMRGTTVLEGIRKAADDSTRVTYEPGSTIRSTVDLDAARQAATNADTAVVVLGENWYIHEFGPSDVAGEAGMFPARYRLNLPDAQQELLRAVQETGTPTVLVLVTGRPLAIPWAAEHVPAILLAYYPGTAGGTAVAETLFGENNPSGKLPVSVPRSAGHLPTRFNYLSRPRPIGEGTHPPSYDPLFPFGHGLSYTEFEYESLDLSDSSIGPGGTVEASVLVRNVGDRPGREAVDLYITDLISSTVTPVRELVGFGSVELDPGAAETVTVPIHGSDLRIVRPDGRRVVEAGEFRVTCGNLDATFAVESEYGPVEFR